VLVLFIAMPREIDVWWSIEAGVHVEPHSHTNEQIVWMLKGKMELRLGSEQRVCGQGDVVVIPGGTVEMSDYEVKSVEPIVVSNDIQVRVFTLAQCDVIPWHYHRESTDHYFVLQGASPSRPEVLTTDA
jgi:quercetin dioxygenase-like cupin family protein